jgi:low affinity Fe/Cu permease
MKDTSHFAAFANWVAGAAGRAHTFAVACAIILGWALTGPLFDYSDTWQLVINTGTTIITFLMVFVIQNTQNRDSKAMQVKLDELIRATEGAHNVLLDLEQLTERDLNRLRNRYIALAATARAELAEGRPDTGHPDLIPED